MEKIIIIEDDEIIREELKNFLSKYGYEIVAPTSFDNVVKFILNENVHTVIYYRNLVKHQISYKKVPAHPGSSLQSRQSFRVCITITMNRSGTLLKRMRTETGMSIPPAPHSGTHWKIGSGNSTG